MKRNERTYQQWKDLAERYFEAETTPEEEKELACFLATPLSQSKDFEELRAVMGFMAVGRATHRKRQVHTFRYAAAAARRSFGQNPGRPLQKSSRSGS